MLNPITLPNDETVQLVSATNLAASAPEVFVSKLELADLKVFWDFCRLPQKTIDGYKWQELSDLLCSTLQCDRAYVDQLSMKVDIEDHLMAYREKLLNVINILAHKYTTHHDRRQSLL